MSVSCGNVSVLFYSRIFLSELFVMCSMKFNWMVSLVIICQSVGKAASCCCIYIPSLMALCPGRPGSAGTRKVPIWILLKQKTVSGSGISWAICKSAPRSSTPPLSFFTRRMPFLPPNQQRQSTEAAAVYIG